MIPHSAIPIPHFLAELPTPAANELAAWLICAVCVVLGVNAVLKLTDRFRGKEPQPPNEQLRHDHATLARRVGAIESRLERQVEVDNAHRGDLYEKIDATRTELQGQIEDVRKELSSDMRDMPSQIIALLRNTGSIGGNK